MVYWFYGSMDYYRSSSLDSFLGHRSGKNDQKISTVKINLILVKIQKELL
jgi:hypothetical protein